MEALSRRFGKRFGLFGIGWQGLASWQGPVPFDQQAVTARRARVVVGGIPFSRERYYTSNRPFIQVSAGVVMVDTFVPGVDAILRPGAHWVLSDDDALAATVERVFAWDDAKLRQIGAAGAQHIFRSHTQAHRVEEALLENVRRLRAFSETGAMQASYLPFFLSEVDVGADSAWLP